MGESVILQEREFKLYLNKYKLLIFDADGTLRECTIPNQPCPNKSDEWRLIDGVKKKMRSIDWSGIGLGIASNQAGISLGYLEERTAYRLLCDMVIEATGYFPPQGSIQVCPHSLDDNCNCRKPKPGMLLKLIKIWGVNRNEALFVGDMESDEECAKNARVDYISADIFFSGKEWISDGPPPMLWSPE